MFACVLCTEFQLNLVMLQAARAGLIFPFDWKVHIECPILLLILLNSPQSPPPPPPPSPLNPYDSFHRKASGVRLVCVQV